MECQANMPGNAMVSIFQTFYYMESDHNYVP